MRKWTTKDGTKIYPRDMTDQHLVNTMRFIARRRDDEVVAGYSGLSMISGEMASYYAEKDLAVLEESPLEELVPVYEDLVREARKRGLKWEGGG